MTGKSQTRRRAPLKDCSRGDARRALVQYLKSVASAGVSDLPRPVLHRSAILDQAATADDQAEQPRRPSGSPAQTAELFDLAGHAATAQPRAQSTGERSDALHVIAQQVAACTRCADLARSRTQTVFGVGNPAARLCFVGEAPGAEEDRQGEPFVGAAGKLLDKILAACRLTRGDVYILNTLKCRPPGNRNPNEQELANCWGYAQEQLAIIDPEFICCLGGIAAQTVLQTKLPIGRLRQKFHQAGRCRVVVTYHPAYLLRNPNAKRLVWDDMKMLLAEMGVEWEN